MKNGAKLLFTQPIRRVMKSESSDAGVPNRCQPTVIM